MSRYLALLRGINVGGNTLIRMPALIEALSTAGLEDVRTYIQSGNVIFSSNSTDTIKLAKLISKTILEEFKLVVPAVVFSKEAWTRVIASAPKWWGNDQEWKHNLLILLPPFEIEESVFEIGELKPEIESMEPGEGVLYQSVSFKSFGRTRASKMIGTPIYKRMTIRNYNTANKLLPLLG